MNPFKYMKAEELLWELEDTFSWEQAEVYQQWKRRAEERAEEARVRAEKNRECRSKKSCSP